MPGNADAAGSAGAGGGNRDDVNLVRHAHAQRAAGCVRGSGVERGGARDPAAAARMGEAGRARAVGEFGWDAVARRTVRLYQEIVKQA